MNLKVIETLYIKGQRIRETDKTRAYLKTCPTVCLVAQSCLTLCDPMDCSPPGFSVRGDSPGQNTGVGCHAILQDIFPTQGSNPGLLH